MSLSLQSTSPVPLRPPQQVMRLSRLGAAFPTRLSFMRSLIRRLAAERVRVERRVWNIDRHGHGRAVYALRLGGEAVSLVAISTPLAPEDRTDRVIASAWDTTYVLYDGVPDSDELDRIAASAPHQEAARFTERDLVLSRANKSVRLFEHVVACLAAGGQPDRRAISEVGYLMRTTAVYGNGKFGIADRGCIAARPALSGPFQAEMLTVWLIRAFTHDLVEHVAAARSPETAVTLDLDLKRTIGIGNSTGLGMAPFLVTHPELIDAWFGARETALARVRGVGQASSETIATFRRIFARALGHLGEWQVADRRQMARIERLRTEGAALHALATPDWLTADHPWERLMQAAEGCSEETQEFIVALILEPHGALIDNLAERMGADCARAVDASMPVSRLLRLIETAYDWALEIDFESPDQTGRFWYVSEEKLEPRLGLRDQEPGAELESPLDIARQVQMLADALRGEAQDEPTGLLLLRRPDLRAITRRVQCCAALPYAEIRDNLISTDCLAIDLLRAKLAFFGASKFDPKSDKWTRITLFQGAPTPEDIALPGADDWAFPEIGGMRAQ